MVWISISLYDFFSFRYGNMCSSRVFSNEAFISAIRKGDVDAVKSAIKNGENVNLKDRIFDWYPLHHAAENGTS